jgi:hypothetical protein
MLSSAFRRTVSGIDERGPNLQQRPPQMKRREVQAMTAHKQHDLRKAVR